MSYCACHSRGNSGQLASTSRPSGEGCTWGPRLGRVTLSSSKGMAQVASLMHQGQWESRKACQAPFHMSKVKLPLAACTATNTSVTPTSHGTNGCADRGHEKWLRTKSVDVTTLGNMCVDIVLNVPELPPQSMSEKFDYMQELVSSPPDESCWEAGGNCNFAIAGARLGLHCVTLGHVGNEKFGHFLHRVLDIEGVQLMGIKGDDGTPIGDEDYDGTTLLCWVLVDPQHQHAFCSRFDFNKNPAFNRIQRLPEGAEALLQRSKALFINGFVFDELAPPVVLAAAVCAQAAGGAVFFDPGPRAYTLFQGPDQQRCVLDQLLCLCDVLLLTADEAQALTGIADPRISARALLEKGKGTKWVVLKMGANGCLIATAESFYDVPGFKVEVVDTVGCGDSFAAAVVLGYIMRASVPITTTLALANAVGAATAMGQGAGRNVASAAKVVELLAGGQNSTDALLEEHPSLFTPGKMTADTSFVTPLTFPMQAASHDALSLLKGLLKEKAPQKELLV